MNGNRTLNGGDRHGEFLLVRCRLLVNTAILMQQCQEGMDILGGWVLVTIMAGERFDEPISNREDHCHNNRPDGLRKEDRPPIAGRMSPGSLLVVAGVAGDRSYRQTTVSDPQAVMGTRVAPQQPSL